MAGQGLRFGVCGSIGNQEVDEGRPQSMEVYFPLRGVFRDVRPTQIVVQATCDIVRDKE